MLGCQRGCHTKVNYLANKNDRLYSRTKYNKEISDHRLVFSLDIEDKQQHLSQVFSSF